MSRLAKLRLIFGLVGVFAACMIVIGVHGGQKASALSNAFVDGNRVWGVNPGGVSLVIEDTDSVSVPSSTYKWFIPMDDFSNKTLILYGFCAGAPGYVGLQMYDQATAGWPTIVNNTYYGNVNGIPWIQNTCQGANLVISNIDNGYFQDQIVGGSSLYRDRRVLLITATLANGTAAGNINKFVAVSTTGSDFITQAEIGGNYSKSTATPIESAAFAILGDKVSGYGYSIDFTFKADCHSDYSPVDGAGNNFYLHWRDEDYNLSYGSGSSWQLLDSAGNLVDPGYPAGDPRMGTTNQPAYKAVTLVRGQTYTWRWSNMNHVNTLHMWMPFSEMGQFSNDCDTQPPPPDGSLDGANCASIDGWALDPNVPAQTIRIALYHGAPRGAGGTLTGVYSADQPRVDVNNAYYGKVGNNHGFHIITTDEYKTGGAEAVYVYALGISIVGSEDGSDSLLGNGTIACPPPQVTISGRLFTMDDPGLGGPFGSITIETCTGQYPVTGADGVFSFQIPKGTPFCIRAASYPAYTDLVGIRPWNFGSGHDDYLGCGPFGGYTGAYNTNSCAAFGYSTYEYQVAGIYRDQPGIPNGVPSNIDRYTDGGYDIVFHIPDVTVQGRVYYNYNDAATPGGSGQNGVQIDYCQGSTITASVAGSPGYYSFTVKMGSAYCARASGPGYPANTAAVRTKPWGVAYPACGPTHDGYCQATTYEAQLAGAAAANGYDRYGSGTYEQGYDLILIRRPVVECHISGGGTFVIGDTNLYTPTATVRQLADSASVQNMSGTVTVSMPGVPTSSGGYTVNNGAPASSVPLAPAGPFALTTAGHFTPNGTASGNYSAGNWWDVAIDPNPVTCIDDTTVFVGYAPYMKMYGGNVWAGGNFVPNCNNPGEGGIYAVTRAADNASGASSQFSVSALLTINNFYSASNRNPASGNTVPPKGLTTANNTAATFGGNSGAGSRCMKDYYVTGQDPDIMLPAVGGLAFTPGAGVTPAIPGGARSQYSMTAPAGTAVTMGGFSIPVGSQTAVFVDGDVYINDNITFTPGAPNLRSLPNFTLVVKGNIRIAPGVTQIDGMYIAQPRDVGGVVNSDPNTGKVFTCASGPTSIFGLSKLYANCRANKLAINGGLIAQQIKWMRVFGNVADSVSASAGSEEPDFNTGSSATSNAAETVNYTPEAYLAPNALKDADANPTTGSLPGVFRAITTLPPIF